jgi:hypothetical protein
MARPTVVVIIYGIALSSATSWRNQGRQNPVALTMAGIR